MNIEKRKGKIGFKEGKGEGVKGPPRCQQRSFAAREKRKKGESSPLPDFLARREKGETKKAGREKVPKKRKEGR